MVTAAPLTDAPELSVTTPLRLDVVNWPFANRTEKVIERSTTRPIAIWKFSRGTINLLQNWYTSDGNRIVLHAVSVQRGAANRPRTNRTNPSFLARNTRLISIQHHPAEPTSGRPLYRVAEWFWRTSDGQQQIRG